MIARAIPSVVIPAHAGIQTRLASQESQTFARMDSRLRGNDGSLS
jgi:hypothetical protein